MTVFLNNTLALVNYIFPKRENRDYCEVLREAAYICIRKNYNGHPPCKEIYELFRVLDCSSKEVRFLKSDGNGNGNGTGNGIFDRYIYNENC